MREKLRDNGLSVAMFSLFLFAWIGQIWTGYAVYNDNQQQHHQKTVSLGEYLTSGHFVEATFENWESEFLQMGAFVVLTIFLRQKGSPESKKLDEDEAVDAEPDPNKKDAPAPVKRGSLMLTLYRNSLSLALFGLFFISFFLHAAGGAKVYNEDQKAHGQSEQVSTLEFMRTSDFWFQSFQNWQSEFLSVGALIVLSIYLRQIGSPESKPVDHPSEETGEA